MSARDDARHFVLARQQARQPLVETGGKGSFEDRVARDEAWVLDAVPLVSRLLADADQHADGYDDRHETATD